MLEKINLFFAKGVALWGGSTPSRDADLEKAARGASGTCGHFVENHTILRTF